MVVLILESMPTSAYSVNNDASIGKLESYFRPNFFVHLTFYAFGSPPKLLSNLIRPGLGNFFYFSTSMSK